MAEGARLESVYTETYRGFESLSDRQLILKINSLQDFMKITFHPTYKQVNEVKHQLNLSVGFFVSRVKNSFHIGWVNFTA